VQAIEGALNSNAVMRIRTPRGWVNTQGSDGTILLMPMTQTVFNPVQPILAEAYTPPVTQAVGHERMSEPEPEF
jgi:hypothetical protein